MSMAVCGIDRSSIYPPSLIAFFDAFVNKIFKSIEQIKAQLLESVNLTIRLLEEGAELAYVVEVIAENDIPLDEGAISEVREIALWMEACLDGNDHSFIMSETQKSELERIYIAIVSALSTILIHEEMR